MVQRSFVADRLLLVALLASFAVLPSHVYGSECTDQIIVQLKERLHGEDDAAVRALFHYSPTASQNPKTGEITVDLEGIQNKLLPELKRRGLHPDAMLLEVDGGAVHHGRNIPVPLKILGQNPASFAYAGGPLNRQQYVRVVFLENGREIHVTDNALIEKKNFPKIDAKTYAEFHDPRMELPKSLTQAKEIDPSLVELSSRIQHQNVVFDIDPSPKFLKQRKAFEKYGSDLHPRAIFKNGKIAGWRVEVPPASGKVETWPAHSVRPRGGAAFSQHTFYWDDHYVAESLANTDPETALNTALYWLDHQNADGSWARELDYKGTPYHRAMNVRFGQEVPNREYLNPPLSGWTWAQLYAWNPTRVAPLLPRVVKAMERQRAWLLNPKNGYAVYDESGKLVGFRWTNLGSGEDNAPTGLDQFGLDSLPKYRHPSLAGPDREKSGLSVALLSQYKIMLDEEADFLSALGKAGEARKLDQQSKQIAQLLREKYRSPQGWYRNLEPVDEKDWQQEPVETLGGFWAIAAKTASRDEVKKLIEDDLKNPDKFGGPLLASVPRDNPYYEAGGAYWRGGAWPPQWRMVSRALREYGLPADAARFDLLHLAAQTAASNDYRIGFTPTYVIHRLEQKWPPNGVPPETDSEKIEHRVRQEIESLRKEYELAAARGVRLNPESTGPGTVYELYGLQRNSHGRETPAWGAEIRSDGTLHETRGGQPAPRQGFGGWGIAVPLTANRSLLQQAVPAYRGSAQGFFEAFYRQLRKPVQGSHLVDNPAFKPLLDYLKKNPRAAPGDLRAALSPEMENQLSLAQKGYIELSPVFDPGAGQTVLRDFKYDGTNYTMKIDRLDHDRVRISVDSLKPIRIQFNRHWRANGDHHGVNESLASSEIFELGGKHSARQITLTLE